MKKRLWTGFSICGTGSYRTVSKAFHGVFLYGILYSVCALLFCSCGKSSGNGKVSDEKSDVKHTKEVVAMDTFMELTAYGAHGEEALEKAEKEIHRLDKLLSVSSTDGEVYIVNENGSEILSEDTAALIEDALELYRKTEGAFDITVYPLMREWGFTDENYRVPDSDRLKELLKNTDASKIEYDETTKQLTLPEGVQIDFGGIAKGYTSARVMEIFRECGVESGIVSLGGNVQTCGKKPDGSTWKIGVQNPDTSADEPYIGTLDIGEKAVITSGGYERYFEQDGKTYHHILDPKTGYPAASGLKSVTIVSADGALADGLSTSLFIMGKEKAEAFWKKENASKEGAAFDVILQDEDGSLFVTEGIEKEFSSDLDFEVIHLYPETK